MRKIHDRQYSQFTYKERLNLTIAALARGDETEANRLVETCPRYSYVTYDLKYTESLSALIILGTLFFEKCVYRYNLIQRAEEYISNTKAELEHEEQVGLKELAKSSQNVIELATKARKNHISALKGLYEGFRAFCIDAGLDSENILQTISAIADCCPHLEDLLATDLQIDTKYTNQMKVYFSEHWCF